MNIQLHTPGCDGQYIIGKINHIFHLSIRIISGLAAGFSILVLLIFTPTLEKIAFVYDDLFYTILIAAAAYRMAIRRLPYFKIASTAVFFNFVLFCAINLSHYHVTLAPSNSSSLKKYYTKPFISDSIGLSRLTTLGVSRPLIFRRMSFDRDHGRVFIGSHNEAAYCTIDLDRRLERIRAIACAKSRQFDLQTGIREKVKRVLVIDFQFSQDSKRLFALLRLESPENNSGYHSENNFNYLIEMDPVTMKVIKSSRRFESPLRIAAAEEYGRIAVVDESQMVWIVDSRSFEVIHKAILQKGYPPFDAGVVGRKLYVSLTVMGISTPWLTKLSIPMGGTYARGDIAVVDILDGSVGYIETIGRSLMDIDYIKEIDSLSFVGYLGDRIYFYHLATGRLTSSQRIESGTRSIRVDKEQRILYVGIQPSGAVYRYDDHQMKILDKQVFGRGLRDIMALTDGKYLTANGFGIFLADSKKTGY